MIVTRRAGGWSDQHVARIQIRSLRQYIGIDYEWYHSKALGGSSMVVTSSHDGAVAGLALLKYVADLLKPLTLKVRTHVIYLIST